MFLKKIVAAGLALSLLTVSAAAHGGRGHHGQGHCGGGSAPAVQTQVTVCPDEACTAAGRHTHNGVIYCGYGHECGYCDNSCVELQNTCCKQRGQGLRCWR